MLDFEECDSARIRRDAAYDGRFFTGVRTTGIYCRPVCPARHAHSKNVEYYPSAAAAEAAGYRPCLRCRPETAPFSPAWKGSLATVDRAMRLVNEGALDDAGVEALAERLGIGARHLLRLFRKHVGASPTQVAQTARVQRAKRTTAVALFWALFLVASAHSVQTRIAAEVAPIDLGPERAADALTRLVYTRATVQEALRLYPPAYGIFRVARKSDDAAGVAIPKGAIVMVAPWLLHRHRRFWRDPDRFDPTRLLPGAAPPDRFAYLPFGIGPRVCIGAQFALTEATLVLARLVQAFEIRRADSRSVTPVAAITVRPDHPPPFHLRRR